MTTMTMDGDDVCGGGTGTVPDMAEAISWVLAVRGWWSGRQTLNPRPLDHLPPAAGLVSSTNIQKFDPGAGNGNVAPAIGLTAGVAEGAVTGPAAPASQFAPPACWQDCTQPCLIAAARCCLSGCVGLA